MTTPRIAIIVGSTRPGRKGSAVGAWVHGQASQRDDATFDLLELADFDLQLLDEAVQPSSANREYERGTTQRWSRTIDGYDGFVWVTAEYNHGVPAAFKNAFDLLYPEWNHKAATLVGYGFAGGVRAVEHWRQVLANSHVHVTRAQVELSTVHDWDSDEFSPSERRPREMGWALDQLIALTGATTILRG